MVKHVRDIQNSAGIVTEKKKNWLLKATALLGVLRWIFLTEKTTEMNFPVY